jgi:hypothetical protein
MDEITRYHDYDIMSLADCDPIKTVGKVTMKQTREYWIISPSEEMISSLQQYRLSSDFGGKIFIKRSEAESVVQYGSDPKDGHNSVTLAFRINHFTRKTAHGNGKWKAKILILSMRVFDQDISL